MNLPESVPQSPEYQPAPTQLERARALQRFNRLFVYLPIGFVSILIVAITGILLYLALFQANEATLTTLSAVADSVVILLVVPTMLLCVIFPAVFTIALRQGRQRGMAPSRAVRRLLWRIDNQLLRVRMAVNNTVPKVTQPLINYHARFAYIRTLILGLKQLVKRS
jgi:hypothetical protein